MTVDLEAIQQTMFALPMSQSVKDNIVNLLDRLGALEVAVNGDDGCLPTALDNDAVGRTAHSNKDTEEEDESGSSRMNLEGTAIDKEAVETAAKGDVDMEEDEGESGHHPFSHLIWL